jgi:hypothetical protein
MVAHSRPSVRWLVPSILILSACTSSPSPSPPPEAPTAPDGWTSVGAIQGETSPAWANSRLSFSGRDVAVHANCLGTGMLFVIVDWKGVSASAGPAAFRTAVFPCGSPIEGELNTRIELPTAPTGAAEVAVFVVEGQGAISPTRFGVSIEERGP